MSSNAESPDTASTGHAVRGCPTSASSSTCVMTHLRSSSPTSLDLPVCSPWRGARLQESVARMPRTRSINTAGSRIHLIAANEIIEWSSQARTCSYLPRNSLQIRSQHQHRDLPKLVGTNVRGACVGRGRPHERRRGSDFRLILVGRIHRMLRWAARIKEATIEGEFADDGRHPGRGNLVQR